jgi:hypothetical protein
MALEIVWRNPFPLPRNHKKIEPIVVDAYGAVYAVRCADETEAFELIPGGAALKRHRGSQCIWSSSVQGATSKSWKEQLQWRSKLQRY